MPKRELENDSIEQDDAPNKRSRQTGHTSDCNDPDCEGCDVGDIEITFVNDDNPDSEPTARDLLNMALEECQGINMQDASEEKNAVVRRLFDMALEQYQKHESDDRIGYADCLVEVGRALDVEESLREGVDIFRSMSPLSRHKSTDASSVEQARLLLLLARATFSLAVYLRKRKNAVYEELLQEQESDEEDNMEELAAKQAVTREEIKLYKESIAASDKAFELLTEAKENLCTTEARQMLHEMRLYAQLLDQPSHQEHVQTISKRLIYYLEQMPTDDDDDLLALWAAVLVHQLAYVDQPKQQQAMLEQADKMLLKSKSIYYDRHKQENPWVLELYGTVKLSQCHLAEDDDDVLQKMDEAVEAFETALKLNPGNQKLKEMLDTLKAQDDNNQEDNEQDDEQDAGEQDADS